MTVLAFPKPVASSPSAAAPERRADVWLSAQEIAVARLPGMPRNKRKVNELAARERWAFRVAPDGSELARSRKGRGGGIEYHVDLLPPAARSKVLASNTLAGDPSTGSGHAAQVKADNDARSSIWSWFEQQKQSVRDQAADRLAIVLEIEQLITSGLTVTAAIGAVSARHGIGKSTLNNWRNPLQAIPRTDWLPHLASRWVPGGKKAEIDADIWKAYVSQLLLPSGQAYQAAYADAKRLADARGITLPRAETMLRRARAEIDPLLWIKCREGRESFERALPSIIRDVSHMHAMQQVNIDGHLWDVRVEWPDGTVSRPMMVAIQDVYSRKLLAWHIDKSENSVSVRKAFEKLLRQYGVPMSCLCDNGRAFASKWISGGSDTRNRYQIRPDDPLGLLPALGIKVDWAQPYHGQSKPIERTFGMLAGRISKSPEFSGAYTGRSPMHKPHDYGKRAVPLAEFIAVVDRRIAEINAESGRKTQMGAGKRSVDEVFAESYASAPIGKATPEALALALMDATKAKVRRDGTVGVAGNRYWHIDLSRRIGEQLIVRYNPDDLKADVRVYTLEGALIGVASVWDARGFDDIKGASEIKKLRSDARKATKKQIEAMDLLSAAQLAELARQAYADTGYSETQLPDPGAIRPVRHRGQTAAALKPVSAPAERKRSQAQAAAAIDELAEARKLRLID